MKKFLIVAFAALGFVACNDNNFDDVNNGGFTGEVETSYIAINLNAAESGTRAPEDYQDGLAAERVVNAAYFFFFDPEGNAFPVTGSPATEPGGSVNWISANLTGSGTETPNVSDIKDAVLVLSTYKGTYPAQVVAVLNWAPDTGKAYKLAELYAATNIKGVSEGFVMSNAVYANGTNAVVGTPIKASDIYKSDTDALAHPITIYVERIAAKVTVTAKNGVENNRYFVKKANISGVDTDVYVQVTGWELYNDFAQSKLIKDINPAWDSAVLGFTWNDSPYYRCYWAESLEIGEIGTNAFPTEFGLKLGDAEDVDDDGIYANDTYTYVGENTNYDAATNNTANCTKVIIKAKLQKKVSETVYEDLPMTRWYTTYYATLNDLLTAVANTIKYQYYWFDGADYQYITPGDLTVVEVGNMVKFALSTGSEGKNWYVNGAGSYVSKTKDEINESLGKIEKAVYYDASETLYAVDIAHLAYANPGVQVGDYGVVRNHIYNVVLRSFGGFGSPVYEPGAGENFEYPEDPSTGEYVSAEVRILSWRLVSQEVDVQP